MKIALYARVSKDDGSQTTDNQLEPLRKYASAMGWEVVKEYVEMVSGGGKYREEFNNMLSDSDKHLFDTILIWSLDRFSREGTSTMLGYVDRLKRNKVGLCSLQERWLDISDSGIATDVILPILAWVAKMERQRISERTKAGLARAKAQGVKLGRKKGSKDKVRRVRSGYVKRWRGEKKNG
jgi:DNA invertase Pin-like site-specific DNA recombinase